LGHFISSGVLQEEYVYKETMRIALLNLTGGGIGGGYRKYLHNMIPRLASHPEVASLLCATPAQLNIRKWVEPLSNVQFVDCRPFRFMNHTPDPQLTKYLEQFCPEVIFFPLERYLKFKNVPVVTLIRNMEPLSAQTKPKALIEKLRVLSQTLESRIAAKRSKRVIAVSKFVRDFIVKKWDIPPEKIALIYFGADISNSRKGCRPDILPEDWKNKFLFTAGSIELYRGLEDLITAMGYLAPQNTDLKLVIAGEHRKIMENYNNKLRELIKLKKLSKNVLWTGNLNEEEMTWCFQHCTAFVMTTRVEACPNTALESLSNGCISVAADNPPLPEVFHDSAFYYSPGDGRGLAHIIEQILNYDNTTKNEISEHARRRASFFSWDITVQKTVEELSKAIGATRF
jgi:glycosyltransferase involved in cell wall biosynthesis